MIFFVIGIAAFIFANVNLLGTRLGWEPVLRFRDRLRERHGPERGDLVYTVTFIVLPLVVAAVAIWRGMYPA